MPTPSPWPPLAMSCLQIIAESAALVMVFTFVRGVTSGTVFDRRVPPFGRGNGPPAAASSIWWHLGVTSGSV
uniref:Putative secreted protein n=1 Tax=Anopheles darlingi TaxID=43151 RepID=A0A2M4DES5_ANODA